MLTYIPVSFLFSFNFRVRVRVKNRVRVRVSFRVGLGFGIGNLIGGAAGTVDPCARKTPVAFYPLQHPHFTPGLLASNQQFTRVSSSTSLFAVLL